MKKYFCVFISIIMLGCNYNNDKLKVQNITDKEIWFVIMCKNKIENKFYFTHIESLVYPKETTSAILQVVGLYNKNCEEILKNRSLDNKLYVVFFNPKETGPIENTNPNLILNNNKIIVKTFTKKELDKIDWIVKYNGT